MSALYDIAFKLLLLLHQEFEAAFEEVTKNVVLQTNLKQKSRFGIQKTAYANFTKLHQSNGLYIEQVPISTRACLKSAKRN